ncbi:transposase [Corynebacterium timonense]|uniref:transposase n=1 Tax=Corynebacterium timonense TaxID=441500 RepID=UPI0015616E11
MSQSRKKFTPEYGREAAKLVIELDLPIAHVAGEIGVRPALLGTWVKNERERRGSSDGIGVGGSSHPVR